MAVTASFRRTVVLVTAGALTLLATFIFGVNFDQVRSASTDYFYSGEKQHHLHLLLPATASDNHFCKLLLSSGIVGFPEPTFVGWGGHGMYNGSNSHLFKISETLVYLRSLPAEQDDDLVLILDAYDVWLQMPPEVIITRYHQVLRAQNERLKQWGSHGTAVHGTTVKNTVLFGADPTCWPQSPADAACWAAPNSTLDPHAFGPDTDLAPPLTRPRWLNSGTILGPVKDVRDVFGATMDMISRRFDAGAAAPADHGSDQYYFAEVWAEQELRRLAMQKDPNSSASSFSVSAPDGSVPQVDTHRRTEFGIAVDSGSALFQSTAAAADRHLLAWMRFNHSSGDADARALSLRQTRRPDQWVLAPELAGAPSPFAATDALDDLPKQRGWADVSLATNMVTGDAVPVLHVTGDETGAKREAWWPRMWFHPYAEELLKARKKMLASAEEQGVVAVVDGVKWKSTPPPLAGNWDRAESVKVHRKSGAWTDRGEFIPFEDLCAAYEGEGLYVGRGD